MLATWQAFYYSIMFFLDFLIKVIIFWSVT